MGKKFVGSLVLWGVFVFAMPSWANEIVRSFKFTNGNSLRYQLDDWDADYTVVFVQSDGVEKPLHTGKGLGSLEFVKGDGDRGENSLDVLTFEKSEPQTMTWFRERKGAVWVGEDGRKERSCIGYQPEKRGILVESPIGAVLVESARGEQSGVWMRKIGESTCISLDDEFRPNLNAQISDHGELKVEGLSVGVDLKTSCLAFDLPYSEAYRVRTCENFPRASGKTGVWIERVSDHKVFPLDKVALKDWKSAIKVNDGILSVKGIRKKVDLAEFDAEVRMFSKARAGEIVKDVDDTRVDPIAALDMYTDLVEDSQKNPERYPEVADIATTQRIARALRDRSVVLLGRAGSGKSSLVKAFANRVGMGLVRGFPRTTQIFRIDVSSFASGTRFVGTIEKRISTLKAAAQATGCIFFFDEMHSLEGVGTHSNQTNDITQYIKGPLETGEMKIIGTDTQEEFLHAFGKDEAFMSRFAQVVVEGPEGDALAKVLKAQLRGAGEALPSQGVLDEAVRLSNEYEPVAAQPRAAVNLLRMAYAVQADQGNEGMAVTQESLTQAVQELYGFNPENYTQAEITRKLSLLEGEMKREVIGQEDAKGAILSMWGRKLTGVGDQSRVNSLLFVGPSGVGKSQLAGLSADRMGYKKTTIEMEKYKLGGADDFQRELYAAIRKFQFQVFVLDEFEKAHISVQDAALSILENGRFVVHENRGGRSIRHEMSAKHCLFILTSNAGATFIRRKLRHREVISDLVLREVLSASTLSGPILSRIREIVPMGNPRRAEFEKGLRFYLDRALERESLKASVTFTLKNYENFIEAAMEVYEDENSDYRQIHRLISEVEDLIVKKLLEPNISEQKKAGGIQLEWIVKEFPKMEKPYLGYIT